MLGSVEDRTESRILGRERERERKGRSGGRGRQGKSQHTKSSYIIQKHVLGKLECPPYDWFMFTCAQGNKTI